MSLIKDLYSPICQRKELNPAIKSAASRRELIWQETCKNKFFSAYYERIQREYGVFMPFAVWKLILLFYPAILCLDAMSIGQNSPEFCWYRSHVILSVNGLPASPARLEGPDLNAPNVRLPGRGHSIILIDDRFGTIAFNENFDTHGEIGKDVDGKAMERWVEESLIKNGQYNHHYCVITVDDSGERYSLPSHESMARNGLGVRLELFHREPFIFIGHTSSIRTGKFHPFTFQQKGPRFDSKKGQSCLQYKFYLPLY